MIDARDHVGVPVITDCPMYFEHAGVRYEAAADAFTMREGDCRFTGLSPDPLRDASAWRRYIHVTPPPTFNPFTTT